MSEKKVRALFRWNILRPDTRQYKQQSVEVYPLAVDIEVLVPESMVAIYNPDGPEVVLTLAGMKYVQDQFEKLYEQVSPESASDWDSDIPSTAPKGSTNEWDDSNFLTGKAPEEEKEETADGWDADPVFDEDNKMSGNAPDTEMWNEDEEDWK